MKLKRYLLLVCLLCPVFAHAQRPLTIVSGVVTANVTDYSDFAVPLNANVTGVTLSKTVTPATGYQVTMRFVQDATGSRTVTFGGNITTSCSVNATALAVTICRWQYTASGDTWADASSSGSSSPGSIWYFSKNCGGASNCTQVLFDANAVNDGTTTNASNIVSCPNSDCKFLTTAKVGQIFFATDSNGQTADGASNCLDNPDILFGGVNETTISSVDSDTQIRVVGNSGTTSTAKACMAWGDDDTTAINNGVNAAPCTANYTFPLGYTLISLPIIQAAAGCPSISTAPAYQAPMVTGQNVVGTFFVPRPTFNFASITGGNASVTPSMTAAFGNYNIVQYKDFSIWGMGHRCSTLANTALFLAGSAARVYNVDGIGWCGRGGGATLTGMEFVGALDVFSQGGSEFFGSREISIDNFGVYMLDNYIIGNASGTAGVLACGIYLGFLQPATAYFDNNWAKTCINVGNGTTNSAEVTMVHTRTEGNPYGTADSFCLFVLLNSVVNLISRDQVCLNPRVNEGAIQFVNTGASVAASRGTFNANGTASVIAGATSNTFIDYGGNTYSGGAGNWNGSGLFVGLTNSATGTACATGNFALTSGWGTSTVASVAAQGNIQGCHVTITGAAGSASPVLTWTYPAVPVAAPGSCHLSGASGTLTGVSTGTPGATTVAFTFTGTPSAQSYSFDVGCP